MISGYLSALASYKEQEYDRLEQQNAAAGAA